MRLLLSFLVLMNLPLVAEDSVGWVASVTGKAWVVDDTGRRPLKEEDVLLDGERILTDASSSVEVSLGGKNQLFVDSSSNLIFEADEATDLEIEVGLDFGTLRPQLNDWKSSQRFRIVTPTAVAGVRGTDFVVQESLEEGISVDVMEGEVEVEGKLGQRIRERIRAGLQLRLDRRGEKSRAEITAQRLEKLKDRLKFRKALSSKFQNLNRQELREKAKGFIEARRQRRESLKKSIREKIQEKIQDRKDRPERESKSDNRRDKIRERLQQRR